jgi:hypothetical protein
MKPLMKRSTLCLAIAAGISGYAQGQETSSAILGKITAPDGSPAADTRIILVHEPSGTVSQVKTNSAGSYSMKGLRIGGPYKITIDSDIYRDAEMRDLYLQLGKVLRLDQTLEKVDAGALEEVVVIGTMIASSTKGASSVFSEDDIKKTPAFSRDIKDIIKSNPLVVVDESGQLSIAGSNPRFNNITVDGIGQNDDFGLNYSGYPSSRPPVSLDAVSQISVDAAPFTAKVGGFSGGLVNVVTKSGTNDLHGSVFYETMQDSLSGDPEGGGDLDLGEETTMGFTVGGPLLQDKAFFFVSYESLKQDMSPLYSLNGAGGNASNISAEDYASFSKILQDTYGLSDSVAGGAGEKDEKILVKFDVNLGDDHRMDFSYQKQDNEFDRNSSDQAYQLRLNSNFFTIKTQSDTYSAHLFSDWTDAFSTQFGLSYKDLTTDSLKNSELGEVTVNIGSNEILFGADRSRHANIADTQTLQMHLDGTYLLGNHELRFGYQNQSVTYYNLFGQYTDGVWEFNSLADFEAKKPAFFAYRNAYTNKAEDLAYSAKRTTHALYAEDSWALTSDFLLTFGLRYEQLTSNDVPQENARFVETYGYSNTENLDGLDILLPRINFNWNLNETMTLRGGIGRFSGGKPNVWLANSFTNDGLTYVAAPSSATNAIITDPANVDFSQVPAAAEASLVRGTGSTAYVDPDYELESDWRFQLGWDQELTIPFLGSGYQWSTEFNYIDKQNSSFWVDTSRVEKGRTADGKRIIYKSIYSGSLTNNYDLMLTNASKDGRSIIWTTNLKKDWDNGINMFAAYTHQDITEVNPGTNSTASSNYNFNVTLNRNEELVGNAYYEVEHRFVLNLGYAANWFGDNETRINLAFERRSGRPLSWTLDAYNDNDFGDQRDFQNSDVYLPYIPTGPNDTNIDWAGSNWPGATTNEEKYAAMLEVIKGAGLEAYAGGYAPKYSTTQPWVTDLDLSVQQDFPGFSAGHTGTIYFTIDNLLNLLDSSKGQVRRMEFPQQTLWDYDVNSTTGQYQYDVRFNGSNTKNWTEYVPEASVWRLKLGVRYSF